LLVTRQGPSAVRCPGQEASAGALDDPTAEPSPG
jgi:hypothetical protein